MQIGVPDRLIENYGSHPTASDPMTAIRCSRHRHASRVAGRAAGADDHWESEPIRPGGGSGPDDRAHDATGKVNESSVPITGIVCL